MAIDRSLNQSLIENQFIPTANTIISTERIDYITSKFFRPYQIEMWNEFKNTFTKSDENAWQFWAGTGSGKTEIFKFIFPYMISKANEEKQKEGLVFGLVCHRLCLIKDLNTRVLPIMFAEPDYNDIKRYADKRNPAGCGLNKDKVKYYIVNSGNTKTTRKNLDSKEDIDSIISERSAKIDNIIANAKYVKNMTKEELKSEIENNKKAGIHSMFICLYQSVAKYESKLSQLDFDFLICDEVHAVNTMGNDVFKGCINFFETVKRRYNFTASPQIHKDDFENMNKFSFIQQCANIENDIEYDIEE